MGSKYTSIPLGQCAQHWCSPHGKKISRPDISKLGEGVGRWHFHKLQLTHQGSCLPGEMQECLSMASATIQPLIQQSRGRNGNQCCGQALGAHPEPSRHSGISDSSPLVLLLLLASLMLTAASFTLMPACQSTHNGRLLGAKGGHAEWELSSSWDLGKRNCLSLELLGVLSVASLVSQTFPH